MNIFVTDKDPRKCAEALDDKRVGKMLIESNQILSTVLQIQNPKHWEPQVGEGKLSKKTHVNHPVVKWAAYDSRNFFWLLLHAEWLGEEWKYRFNKEHGSYARTLYIIEHNGMIIPGANRYDLSFINCAGNKAKGIDCTKIPNVFIAYRKYLTRRWWAETPKWTNRDVPHWYITEEMFKNNLEND